MKKSGVVPCAAMLLALLVLPQIVSAQNERVYSLTLEGRDFGASIPSYTLTDIFVAVVPGNYYSDAFDASQNICRAQLFDAKNRMLQDEQAEALITAPTDGVDLSEQHSLTLFVKYDSDAQRLDLVCNDKIMLSENVAVFSEASVTSSRSLKSAVFGNGILAYLLGWY